MKIRDLDLVIISELRITFDEDPNSGTVDIIVPLPIENLSEVLGESVLNMEIHLMQAQGDAIVVSTSAR